MKFQTIDEFIRAQTEEDLWKIIEDYERNGHDEYEAQFLREKTREYCDKYYYLELMPKVAMYAYRHFALKYKEIMK